MPDEDHIVLIGENEELDDSKSILSEPVLKRIWDNEEDDIYDNF